MTMVERTHPLDGLAEPLVSVVVASHNYARFLPESMGSVLAQTYANWECIVIDDASTDGTPSLVEAWVRRDDRFRYYRNDRNLGVSATRNRGTSLARGEFIAVLDADDWWAPDKLRRQMGALGSSGPVQACFSAYVQRGGGCEVVKRIDDAKLESLGVSLRRANNFLHSSLVARKSAFEAVGGYDTSLPCAHDWDLYLKLLHRFGSRSITYLNEPLTYYRVHGSGVSARWKAMLADERAIVRRSLSAKAWGLRHPIGAWTVIDNQWQREFAKSVEAGHRGRAFACACAMVAMSPFRRWRWHQAINLLSRGPVDVSGDAGKHPDANR
jgi:glycosyltransferase involved in cell wall biosynthesis